MFFGVTRRNYVCFSCRKRWRLGGVCPQCSGEVSMLYGTDRVPPSRDVKAWEELRRKLRSRALAVRPWNEQHGVPLPPLPQRPRLKTHKGLLRSIKI